MAEPNLPIRLVVVAALCFAPACAGASTAVDPVATTQAVPAETGVVAESVMPGSTAPIAESKPFYSDPGAPIEDRIADLISRMSLDDKIGQMTLVEKDSLTPSDVAEYRVGAVLSGGGGAPRPNNAEAWLEMTTGFADAATSTELAIPLLYGADAIHGHNNVRGAVIFPHQVALGAVGSPELVEATARVTAIEARATGVNWNFAPVVAVPGDVRWGRAYEAFGEDPDLVAELGVAYLSGLHDSGGDGLTGSASMLATPKHFVGDGATSWGTSGNPAFELDQGDARLAEWELRSRHLAPYVDAIEAGALSIMASYSSWNGDKVHGHQYLLTDVLKGELGFGGFVVSDWGAVDQIDPGDYYSSVVAAIGAGVDMVMVPYEFELFQAALRGAVTQGDIDEGRIDDAVSRILRAKFALGLFDARADLRPEPAVVGSPDHRELAAEVVARSQVLLLNDATTLPISEQATVLVAGVAADDVGRQSGGWTISWQGASGDITTGTTILDGIRRQIGSEGSVQYNRYGRFDPTESGADAVGIVVIGEGPYAEGAGDSPDLAVSEREHELVARVAEQVDRVVVVVVAGRPLILGDIATLADAVVAAWLPGSEGGAVADPLFGDVPFEATTPFSWPRSIEQLPFDLDSELGTGCAGPMFAAGHGLTVADQWSPEPCAAP